MAFWRLQPKTTPAEVLGFNLYVPGAFGRFDFLKTSQTCNGAPVFAVQGGGVCLFVGMDEFMEGYWFISDQPHASMSEYDYETDETIEYNYAAKFPVSSHMWEGIDPDMTSFEEPTIDFFNSTNWDNGYSSGTFSMDAAYVYSPVSPILDSNNVDVYGRIRRVSTALDIPREGLVFDAPLASQSAKALTGQALTYDITASGTIFETVGGLPCMRGTWSGGDGHIAVSFPDTALPKGSAARTVSLWAYPTAGFTEDMMWICWGDASAGYGKICNLGTKDGNYPTSVALWANRNHDDWYSGIQLTLNAWWHVVFIAAYGRVEAWVNGVRKGDYAWSIDTALTGTAYLGTDSAGNGFEGRIAGVRIYNRVLSEAEILRLYDEHKKVVS